MIEHYSVVALVFSMYQKHFTHTNSPSTYSMTNYIFDIFGLEYGLCLLFGGSVEIGDYTFKELDASKYTFIQLTPSILADRIMDMRFFSHNTLLIGGEQLNRELSLRLKDSFIHYIHCYGPTETTIWSTTNEDGLSIGRALYNQKIYILDDNLAICPIGAIGELYIGGVGLARGYLNAEELTKERFIKNPFDEGLIYKTGDLVRYLADGTIEYIGRNDFQVKIRGYRIELGEIEGLIRAYDGIEQTVVVCIDLPEPNLVAYYVAKDLNEENLKNYLASYLPSYMLPTAYVQLEYLPLTVNGKLDRKALPIPTFELDSYVAPHNEIEFEISKIWQEVLKLNQVGMRDDFFKLGGHSILAIQLTHRMSAFLNKSISLKDIFEYKTIERLLENTQKGDKLGEIPKAQEPYVLS
ncbi:hypothetical protein EBU95_19045, partial [bacterium]|nr:hypothetical protein [bacterium]